MAEKDTKKKSAEGDELNQEELDTVTGAIYNIPVGGNTGGTTHTIDGGGGYGGGGGYTNDDCKTTTDTGIMGCSG